MHSESAAGGKPRLVVISNHHFGLAHVLDGRWVTIGRAPGNAFQISDASVSGQHCEVLFRDNVLQVRDMRSTNGTFIKGTLVTEGVVDAGGILRLGEVELRLEVPATAPSPSNGATAAPARTNGHATTYKHQLLLVDDSMAFLELAGEVFDSLAHGEWKIHQACGADQALALLQQHRVELAVLDINMPMLDGLQLLAMLHRRHPETKLVVLTGLASEARRAQCLAAGAELFLEKPVARDGLQFVFTVLNDLLSWKQREGFSGTLQQVGLADIIQIECLRRSSCILEIHTVQQRGEIYIESGNIVHAEAGEGLAGERAIHSLLSLPDGRFHLSPFRQPSARTVRGSWECLLMESARIRDEEHSAPNPDKTSFITRMPVESKPADSKTTAESLQPIVPEIKPAPPSEPLPPSELGDEFVVVSTYDGAWSPVNGSKK